MSKGKIPTDGGRDLGQNPFGALDGLGLPAGNRPVEAVQTAGRNAGAPSAKNRGRVEVRRETGGRGGKTVTTASGFTGIGLPEKEQLAKKMQKACGSGGTVKDGQIEIQGDQRDTVMRVLTEAGFRPVLAGG
jgi:translation initiation factor 1